MFGWSDPPEQGGTGVRALRMRILQRSYFYGRWIAEKKRSLVYWSYASLWPFIRSKFCLTIFLSLCMIYLIIKVNLPHESDLLNKEKAETLKSRVPELENELRELNKTMINRLEMLEPQLQNLSDVYKADHSKIMSQIIKILKNNSTLRQATSFRGRTALAEQKRLEASIKASIDGAASEHKYLYQQIDETRRPHKNDHNSSSSRFPNRIWIIICLVHLFMLYLFFM